MKSRRAACTALFLTALHLAGSGSALAQGSRAAAQALFEDGVKLMEEGNCKAAVPKLEESYRQDPAAGTQYKLAICYERTGQFASAWVAWKEVADALDSVGQKEKARKAREFAENLLPKLAYLRVTVAPETARVEGIVIKRDGVEIGRGAWATSIPVDPGDHRVVAEAPGKKPWHKSLTIRVGGEPVEVLVPALEDTVVPDAGLSKQRVAAIVAGSIGVLGLGFGSGFGGAAIAQWEAVKSGDYCQRDKEGQLISNKCDPAGIGMGKTADTYATISNIGFVVGGAGVVAAGILWLTAKPSATATSARWIAPLVSPGSVGVAAGGRF
jgi:hypothetical protein